MNTTLYSMVTKEIAKKILKIATGFICSKYILKAFLPLLRAYCKVKHSSPFLWIKFMVNWASAAIDSLPTYYLDVLCVGLFGIPLQAKYLESKLRNHTILHLRNTLHIKFLIISLFSIKIITISFSYTN